MLGRDIRPVGGEKPEPVGMYSSRMNLQYDEPRGSERMVSRKEEAVASVGRKTVWYRIGAARSNMPWETRQREAPVVVDMLMVH